MLIGFYVDRLLFYKAFMLIGFYVDRLYEDILPMKKSNYPLYNKFGITAYV